MRENNQETTINPCAASEFSLRCGATSWPHPTVCVHNDQKNRDNLSMLMHAEIRLLCDVLAAACCVPPHTHVPRPAQGSVWNLRNRAAFVSDTHFCTSGASQPVSNMSYKKLQPEPQPASPPLPFRN